jgi:hypothetical protein
MYASLLGSNASATTRFPAAIFPDLLLGSGYGWLNYQFVKKMTIMLN